MTSNSPANCPSCGESRPYSKRRSRHYCDDCELEFEAPAQTVEPQTIFLSYAHKSEREEDYDISEDLVLLIKAELDRDGHTVWIDKEGIRAGSQWRERITAAILEHAHFLSFLSVRSVRDPGVCLNEIAIALGAHKNIQTVLAEDELHVAAPLTISHLQWHDFQGWREIRAGTRTGPMGEDWDTWFAQRIARLREVIADAQNARIPGELQKLREILEPRTFEARIVEKTNGFSGRRWLFEETRRWLEESTSRMFWLKAGPGIGKSSFAAQLAHQARSAVVGFFMCDFQGKKDPEESAREAICTLAFQLASRLPDYRLKLLYSLQLDKDKILKHTADELFEYLITEPLNRSGKIPESTRLCLVIDALDEAGRSGGGNALAELLAKHAERLPEWLGVLVTSRPEPYLEQMLKTLSGTAVDGQSAQNRQDLADWIDQRLPEELRGEQRQQVIEAALEKSGGTFLYLSLIEKDKTLSLADPQNLPDKLDGFFKQTFNRYFPDIEQYGKKTEPFLKLMAAAPGPLPAEMGRQILGWSQRELTLNVIEPMGSLLQQREGGLAFFHASLGDWLQDPSRSGTSCVEVDGPQVLAEFLWCEFIRLEGSAWRSEVTHWLPLLLPRSAHWNRPEDVDAFCTYLDDDSRFRPALELATRHLELLELNPSQQSLAVAKSLYRVGLIQGKLFRPEQSRETLLRALQFLDESEPELLCDIQDAIGVTFKAQARLREAADSIERSLLIKGRSPTIPLASRAKSLDLLGDITDSMGKFDLARDRFEEALSLHAQAGGLSLANPDGAALLNNLAIITLRLHRGLVFGRSNPFISRSREFLAAERMLRIARRLVDTGANLAPRPDFLAYTNNLAIALHGMGDLDSAIELLQDLVGRFLQFRGEDHPDLAIVLNNLGAVLDSAERAESSRQVYDRAIKILDRGSRAGNPHLARCLNNLGALLISENALDEAESHLLEAHQILCGVLSDDHVDSAQCSSNLGAIDFLRGHPAKAVERLRQVLIVRERALGPDHPQTCSTRISLARALLAAGAAQAGNEMITLGVQSLVEGLGAASWAVQALAAKHDQAEALSLARASSTPEPSVRLGIEGVLDQVEDAFRTFEQRSAWSRGADGSYRMQLEVVDILFSHELLMNAA
jgi:tetratricopeptide (TPR) repeat protein